MFNMIEKKVLRKKKSYCSWSHCYLFDCTDVVNHQSCKALCVVWVDVFGEVHVWAWKYNNISMLLC